MRFVVVGDATLDVTVRDATPVAGADRPARIEIGPGGQGANVAVRLARRGMAVRLITAIGADDAGARLTVTLTAEGVDLVNLGTARTGTVVAMIGAAGERAMLSDRAPFPSAALDGLRDSMVDATWLHLSGYPLGDAGSGSVLADIAATRRATTRCSVGGGSFPPGALIGDRLRRARPDLLLFDVGEGLVALNASGSEAPAAMGLLAAALSDRYDAAVVVTDGPNPVLGAMADGSQVQAYPPYSAPAVDSTGAGDAFAAGIIGTLAPGTWPPSKRRLEQALADGIRLGIEAAGQVGAQARLPSEAPP